MAGTSTPTDIVIDAALVLAARAPWAEVGLADIAAEAGLDLAGLRKVVASKAHILALFARRIDELLLAAVADESIEGQAHDRLFDVIMRRLEIMEPWRPAVKSILGAGPGDPIAVAAAAINAIDSQRWLVTAAGIAAPRDGMTEGVRLAGLAFVQQRVMRVWAVDDDPGHARTMAALDRGLRDGAVWLKRLEGPMAFCAGMAKFIAALGGARTPPQGGATEPADHTKRTSHE
jgi:AcrR family transcriptional regulator